MGLAYACHYLGPWTLRVGEVSQEHESRQRFPHIVPKSVQCLTTVS